MSNVVRTSVAVALFAGLSGIAPAQVRIVNLSRQEMHVATFVTVEPKDPSSKQQEGIQYSGWAVIPPATSKDFPPGYYFAKNAFMPIPLANVPGTNGLVNPNGDFKLTINKAKFNKEYQIALFNGYAQVQYQKLDKGTLTHGSDFRAESQTFYFGFASVKKQQHKQTYNVAGKVLYYDINLKEDKSAEFTWTHDKGQVTVSGVTEGSTAKGTKNRSAYVGSVTVYFIR